MTVAALTAKDAKEKQDRFRDSLASFASLAARGYGVNLATDAN